MNRYLAATLALTMSSAAFAHHSSAPHYDRNKPVHIEGTIVSFEFVNPHSFLHVRVPSEEGDAVVWDCELPASAMLHRQGWTPQSFVPGEPVAVDGIAARRDPHGCSFARAVFADGTVLRTSGPGAAPAVADNGLELEPTGSGAADRFVGTWARDLARRATGPGPGDRAPPPAERFTTAGQAAEAGYDQRFDDPSFRCSAASPVRAWSEPGQPTEITLDGDTLKIHHEYMDTERTVALGKHEHPASLAAALYGHSIGWFEGDTLVIDSVGFTAGVLAPHPGILHSDALHLVERLHADENGLSVAWTASDPKFYTKPFSGEFFFSRSSYHVEPYGCTVEHANR